MIDRRELLKLGVAALAFGCASSDDPSRLRARPEASESGVAVKPPAILYVPPKPSGAFALVLHGAGGQPDRLMNRFQPLADEFGVTMLAPKSHDITWDAIRGTFGPDVAIINEALRAAFAAGPVDRKRIAVTGFSDGATYSVAIGRANGDLFTHVMAFSPGFLIPVETVGHPKFFLSHGTSDDVLPIDEASRRIARELRRENLSVKLREFDGKHTLPPEVAREGFEWFTR